MKRKIDDEKGFVERKGNRRCVGVQVLETRTAMNVHIRARVGEGAEGREEDRGGTCLSTS